MIPEEIRKEIMESYPIGALEDSAKATIEFKNNLASARRAIRNVERSSGWGEMETL